MSHSEYIARRLVDPEGKITVWGNSILQAYTSVARLSFVPVLRHFRASDWLVLGTRIFNQLDDEMQRQTHLIMSARDIFRYINWPRSFSYDLKSYADLKNMLINNDEAKYNYCRRRVEIALQQTNAKFIVANSTIDPINRLWLQVAKSAGLKTFCVQHGIYSRLVPSYVLEEDIVDRYIALDGNQSDIVSRNIPANKIDALGKVQAFDWNPPQRALKICFVGEDWERYGFESLKTAMISTYKDIILSPQAKTWGTFYYKPHPSERMFLDIMDFATPLKSKQTDLPDVYIGFSSTFLKEMSSQGKLVIQILDDRTQADNFQNLGYCLSIPNNENLTYQLSELFRSRQHVPFVKNIELSEVLRSHA